VELTGPGDKIISGNVGIGTASLGTALHVYGAQGALTRITSPNNGLYVFVDDTANTFTGSTNTITLNATRTGSGTLPKLRLAGQGGLEFAADANTVRMAIDTNGNVGIGTASPANKLHVNMGSIQIDGNNAGTGVIVFKHTDTTYYNGGHQIEIYPFGNGSTGGLLFYNRTSSTNPFWIGYNGNVGIGTTNPGQKLSVAGTIESTSGGFKFPDGSTQTTAATGSGSGCAGGKVHLQIWVGTSTNCNCSGSRTPLYQCQNGTVANIVTLNDGCVSSCSSGDNDEADGDLIWLQALDPALRRQIEQNKAAGRLQ
jgi:hypothetical protein